MARMSETDRILARFDTMVSELQRARRLFIELRDHDAPTHPARARGPRGTHAAVARPKPATAATRAPAGGPGPGTGPV
jgi:hypothetical protein